MSLGFRKSLLGFNTDDVITYVKKLHNSFNEKQELFKSQIAVLEDKIEMLNKEQEALQSEKAELSSKLAEYAAKQAEMERLGENIGKLYLVAQSNAQSIMLNAEENSKLTEGEISRNMSVIDETHKALEEIRQSIITTTEGFNNELNSLMSSLEAARDKLDRDSLSAKESVNEFTSLLESVSK